LVSTLCCAIIANTSDNNLKMENTASPNQNQKLVLLVEDDPFLSNILMMKLQKEGLNVVHAVDGDDALTKLNEGDYEIGSFRFDFAQKKWL